MDCSQDLLEFDNEVNRINIPRESDPFLPVLPSPDIPEEPLEDGLNTPPITPLQSTHAFVKEERWLFSLPPILPVIPTHSEVKSPSNVLDIAKIGLNPTPCHSEREEINSTYKKSSPPHIPYLTIRRTPTKKKD